jgi:GNAT superfamily N-acetyltransferase
MVTRILHYQRQHGFTATAQRIVLSVKRMLSGSRLFLFYCDLGSQPVPSVGSESIEIKRIDAEGNLTEKELQRLKEVSDPQLRHLQIIQRFAAAATLWICRLNDQIAGYGWSIVGETIEPHFFPLCANDAHLFDFYVFPECRGKGLNVRLVNHILRELHREGNSRAFMEAAEWNTPQLASIRRMPFQQLGCARKFHMFGRLLVIWSPNTTPL